jgi:hypothetical protein
MFIVKLDTNAPRDWTEAGREQLHSDGAGLWADKSFTLVWMDGSMAS